MDKKRSKSTHKRKRSIIQLHQHRNSKTTTNNPNKLRKQHNTKQEHTRTIRPHKQTNNPTQTINRYTNRRNQHTTRSDKMLVQIDTREKDRVKSAKEYYEQQKLEVDVCELEIGDYLFDNKVCYEFKTVSDFVASIQNGKVFNQAINMAETYHYNFVIIQGDDHSRAKALSMSRNYHEITYFGYLGAIASLNRFVTVIESYSPFINEAYYRMLINAKKSLSQKPIIRKFPKKDKNTAFNFLCYTIYGINHKKAKNIVEAYDLKTLSDIQQLTMEKLTAIDGIGEKNAERIMNAIGEQ